MLDEALSVLTLVGDVVGAAPVYFPAADAGKLTLQVQIRYSLSDRFHFSDQYILQ